MAVLALSAGATFPLAVLAADEAQAMSEAQAQRDMEERARAQAEALRAQEESIRRLEATQARLQDAQARREIENRTREQEYALREQDAAIRRMEATQERMNADARQREWQAEDQVRSRMYPAVPYIPNSTLQSPAAPAAPGPADQARRNDAVGKINFAPLSDRLKSYFGTQSGVLVVSAGEGSPFSLQDGDVIIAIDGRTPVDGTHAAAILRSYRPGDRVKLRIQRDRQTIELDTMAPR